MTDRATRILIMSSTFPRWVDDPDPPFIHELSRRLRAVFPVTVLCPHAPGTRRHETMDGVVVRRFRYFFERFELLAYGTGILNKLRHRPLLALLVPFFFVAEVVSLARMLRRGSVDLVNAHWLIPQGLAALSAKLLTRSAVPLVCSLHGGDIFALQGLEWLKRFVLTRADMVAVVSEAMRARVIQIGIAPDRVQVIPMGVDLVNRFVPPAPPGARESEQILFVGRLVEKKGVRYLIEAMPQVLQRHPQARLVVVGNGPEEADLRERAAGLGVTGAVDFRGPVVNRELPGLYQRAGIVVFPSVVDRSGDMEGFGLVLVEALGCACGVVATDLPAVRDIVRHGDNALVVPQKRPDHLAAAITRLRDEPELCERLGRDGRMSVLERYDWSITCQKYARLYRSLRAASEDTP